MRNKRRARKAEAGKQKSREKQKAKKLGKQKSRGKHKSGEAETGKETEKQKSRKPKKQRCKESEKRRSKEAEKQENAEKQASREKRRSQEAGKSREAGNQKSKNPKRKTIPKKIASHNCQSTNRHYQLPIVSQPALIRVCSTWPRTTSSMAEGSWSVIDIAETSRKAAGWNQARQSHLCTQRKKCRTQPKCHKLGTSEFHAYTTRLAWCRICRVKQWVKRTMLIFRHNVHLPN